MKKALLIFLTVALCVLCLTSCGVPELVKYVLFRADHRGNSLHEHTVEWEITDKTHKRIYTCCPEYTDTESPHVDEDNNRMCDECGYIMGNPNDHLLPSGNIACADISSLPEGYNYLFSGEDARAIVDYLSNLTLISDFPENPNEYSGMTWAISLKYDNGEDITVYHFGNMFIRFGNGSWYKMLPEEARQFDTLLKDLNN